MTEKHIFVDREGKEHSFDTEEEMMSFGTRIAIANLVKDGFGEIVFENGEECFKINDKGREALQAMEDPRRQIN